MTISDQDQLLPSASPPPTERGALTRRALLASLGIAGAALGARAWMPPPVMAEAGSLHHTVTGSVYGGDPAACCEEAQTQIADILKRLDRLCAVNARDYGALGDGATDDTAGLQAAIDAASAKGGGIVCVPGGTYMISYPLTMASRVLLRGEGDATVIKAFPATGWGSAHLYHGMIDLVGVQYAALQDMCLHQNGSVRLPAHHLSYGVLINDASDCAIDNITFLDPGLNDEYGHPSGPQLALIAMDELKTGWGGRIGGCYRVSVRKCRFIQSGTSSVDFAIRVLSNWEKLFCTTAGSPGTWKAFGDIAL